MSVRMQRLARLFVEPGGRAVTAADGERRWLAPVAPAAVAVPAVGVLCRPRDARLAAAAAGLALADSARSGHVVVATWGGQSPMPARDRPALPGARREAIALRSAGHAAHATGRLVLAGLPVGEEDAVAAGTAVIGATRAPSVLVAAGARGDGFTRLLGRCDLVLVVSSAGGDSATQALALEELGTLRTPAVAVELPVSPAVAVLARLGAVLAGPLRTAFAVALRGEPL